MNRLGLPPFQGSAITASDCPVKGELNYHPEVLK